MICFMQLGHRLEIKIQADLNRDRKIRNLATNTIGLGVPRFQTNPIGFLGHAAAPKQLLVSKTCERFSYS